MNNKIDFSFLLKGIPCHVKATDQPGKSSGPIIIWGLYPHDGSEFEHLCACIDSLLTEVPYVLAAFEVEDWDKDFSPWKIAADYNGKNHESKALPSPDSDSDHALAASASFRDSGTDHSFFSSSDTFGGAGSDTLRWILQEYLPFLREKFGRDCPVFLIGYSLAGLFSLWSAYETNAFSGIASCSGSLWFPGWDTYVRNHRISHPMNIYLSLGGKEEKTSNAQMAAVGIRTREQEKILKKDPNVSHVILEWNSGGHFADSGKRLAKGIRWLILHEII